MKNNTVSKALYHFAKKHKDKHSTSPRDLNDSLDGLQEYDSHQGKKIHHRTHSCPTVAILPKTSFADIKIDPKHSS
jgi:hypothetical protein